MIVDSLKSFEKYITLHKSFDKVYDFLKKNNLNALEEGRHIIEEGNIWCTVTSYPEKELSELPALEVHDSFVDIHIVLEGAETMGFTDRAKCSGKGVEYDEQKDVAYLNESPEVFISYSEDNFIICFPQDAHAPMMSGEAVKKAVIKVRV